MPIPPPPYNFAAIPEVRGREPVADTPSLPLDLARGSGYLAFVRNGRMETLGVELTSGRLEQIVRLPRQTYLPLITAVATGVFFVAVLLKLYWVAVAGFFAAIAMLLLWTRDTGATTDQGSVPVGLRERVPFHFEETGAPSAWAMTLALAGDAAAFASLAFGLLFLWVIAPNWPPPDLLRGGITASVLAGAGLIAAALAGVRSTAASTLAWPRRREGYLALAAAAQVAASAGLILLVLAVPEPSRHAYGAATLVVLAYVVLHSGVGALLALYGLWRSRTGYVSPARSLDLRIGAQWHFYTAVIGLVALFLVHGMTWVLRS
jgi:cytochrome c oxidase subunit I+III